MDARPVLITQIDTGSLEVTKWKPECDHCPNYLIVKNELYPGDQLVVEESEIDELVEALLAMKGE